MEVKKVTENEEKVYNVLRKNATEDYDKMLISSATFEDVARQIMESLSLPSVSGIAGDFKPLKELVEGELIVYENFPPKDDISEVHKTACEESLKKVEKYYR